MSAWREAIAFAQAHVWVEPTRHAVVVVRWIDAQAAGGFIERAAAALMAP